MLAPVREEERSYARAGVPLLAVQWLWVHRLCRGRGWAHQLMQAATAWAERVGVDLQLYVASYSGGPRLNNAQLVKFYNQYGFRRMPCKGGSTYMVRRHGKCGKLR